MRSRIFNLTMFVLGLAWLALMLFPLWAFAAGPPYVDPQTWLNLSLSSGGITLDCHEFVGFSSDFGGGDSILSYDDVDHSIAGGYPKLVKLAPAGGSSDTMTSISFQCRTGACSCNGKVVWLAQQTPGTSITINNVPSEIENIGGAPVVIDSADDLVMYVIGSNGVAYQFAAVGAISDLAPNGHVKKSGATVYLDEDGDGVYDVGTEPELITAAGAGDNLGNHTATQDLDMAANDILNAGSVTADDVSIDDGADTDSNKWRIGPENASTGMLPVSYGGVTKLTLWPDGTVVYGGVTYPNACPADDSVFVISSCLATAVDKSTLGSGGTGFNHTFTEAVDAQGNDLQNLGNLSSVQGVLSGTRTNTKITGTNGVQLGTAASPEVEIINGTITMINSHVITKQVQLNASAFDPSGGCSAISEATIADYKVQYPPCTNTPTQGVLTQKIPFVLQSNVPVTAIYVQVTQRATSAGSYTANWEVGARCEGDNEAPGASGAWGTFVALDTTLTTADAPKSSPIVTVTPAGTCTAAPYEYRLRFRTTDDAVSNGRFTHATIWYGIDDLSYKP